MATSSEKRAPAQIQLEELDEVFGPGYFEHGRLIFTVARDVPGMMKVAHKLQQKTHEKLGSMVEIIMEHVKHELWLKLHETSASCQLQKGECAYVAGIRCLGVVARPDVRCCGCKVDGIFERIEPFFAKRWLRVQLALEAPARGEFEDAEQRIEDAYVGAGHVVCVLACHPRGFATEASTDGVVHVSQCQPLPFQAITDAAGQAKICFLPAALNKVQVAETDFFHGTEVSLLGADLKSLDQGLTDLTVKLLPK
ncbi:hypothetical protein AK812_SmicGene41432, partial [Symbiodinium microadriaticum]